jgi:hypothetical protein
VKFTFIQDEKRVASNLTDADPTRRLPLMERFIPYLIMMVFGVGTAYRAFASDSVVEPHSEAAVLAADDDWLAAELRGDLKSLDARLMPTYRDVTEEGKVHTKQNLLAGAAKHPNKVTTPPLQAAADFRAQHPVVEHVLIEGDTAILQFESSKPEEAGVIRSVDVFVYKDGHWRGLYSSHNKAVS